MFGRAKRPGQIPPEVRGEDPRFALEADTSATVEPQGTGAGAAEERDAAVERAGSLSDDVVAERRAALQDVMDLMRPAVQMDGGDLRLVTVDYEAGIVEVQLQGACGSCAISATTLQGGVERLLMERLDWVSEVRGGVDESMDPFEAAALGRGAYVPRYY